MTAEKPGLSLADLARADKDKREAAAERSAQHLKDHTEKVRSTADRWADFNRDLPGVIESINGQLAAGKIRLSVKKSTPDPFKPQRFGDVIVTIAREGMATNHQTLTIEAFKSGVGKLITVVTRPQAQTEDFELQDVDRDWIVRTLENFVRRALA